MQACRAGAVAVNSQIEFEGSPQLSPRLRNLKQSRRSVERSKRIVVIGEAGSIAVAVGHPLLAHGGFLIVGVHSLDPGCDSIPEHRIRELIFGLHAGGLLVAGELPRTLITELGELSVLLGCKLLSLLPNSDNSALMASITREGGLPFVEMEIARERYPFDLCKRALDIIVSLIACVLMLPVVGVAALVVAIESPGNPFFGHVRIGRCGRRFRCWKLRTMHADAELRLRREVDLFERYRENDYKLPDNEDPRVTKIGRFLRCSSLDELPQLWNVVVGEMSLVGPRPIVADELQHYRGTVLTLLSVRPGITGAWAVSGRHHLAYPRRAEIELQYVRTRNLLSDVRILWRTIGAVLDSGFGAYEQSETRSQSKEGHS